MLYALRWPRAGSFVSAVILIKNSFITFCKGVQMRPFPAYFFVLRTWFKQTKWVPKEFVANCVCFITALLQKLIVPAVLFQAKKASVYFSALKFVKGCTKK